MAVFSFQLLEPLLTFKLYPDLIRLAKVSAVMLGML